MAIPISASITAIPIEQEARRKPNFTDFEKSFLILQYELYKPMLSSKVCDTNTNRRKQEIWNQITAELNNRNPNVQRTVKDVKKKWENLATQCRKELSDYRQNQGLRFVAPPSALTLKVLELLDDITLRRTDETTAQKSENGVVFGPVPNLDQCGFQFADNEPAAVDRLIKEELDEGEQEINSTNQIPVQSFGVPNVGAAFNMDLDDQSFGQSSAATAAPSPSLSSIQSTLSPLEVTIGQSSGATPLKRKYSALCDDGEKMENCNNFGDRPVQHDDDIAMDIKKLKRLKIKLETEKLMLEKRKLELEIAQLTNQLKKGGDQ